MAPLETLFDVFPSGNKRLQFTRVGFRSSVFVVLCFVAKSNKRVLLADEIALIDELGTTKERCDAFVFLLLGLPVEYFT